MSVFHLLILFIQLLHCAQAVLKKKTKTAAEKSDKREKSIVPSTFLFQLGKYIE